MLLKGKPDSAFVDEHLIDNDLPLHWICERRWREMKLLEATRAFACGSVLRPFGTDYRRHACIVSSGNSGETPKLGIRVLMTVGSSRHLSSLERCRKVMLLFLIVRSHKSQ